MSKKHKRPLKAVNREVSQWCISIIIAVAIALLIHNYVFQVVKVKGTSMEPTLHTGERMVVTRFTYLLSAPKRHDIIVTHYPEDTQSYVKRVIAFGGELSYEPYDDNITVRVLFLKGISVRMALKALDEIRNFILDRPQDYFER